MARSVREMIREVLAEEAAEALAQKTSSGERKRGRRPGYILPTFAEFEELTLEDFAFLRTAVSGALEHAGRPRLLLRIVDTITVFDGR